MVYFKVTFQHLFEVLGRTTWNISQVLLVSWPRPESGASEYKSDTLIKVKVKLSLCLIKHHAVRPYPCTITKHSAWVNIYGTFICMLNAHQLHISCSRIICAFLNWALIEAFHRGSALQDFFCKECGLLYVVY